MSGDHNMYANKAPMREVRISLIDGYCGQDITMIEQIGETIEDLHDAFRRFALAAGFNNDTVKEYFPDE